MSTSTRVFLVVACAFVVLVGGAVGIVAATVYRAGTIEVEVQDESGSFSLRLPGVIVPAVAHLVPEEALREASREISPWLPAIHAALEELATCEDAVFVEVKGDREEITIAKRDGSIIIRVDSDDERVRVSLPLHTLSPVLARLERGARRA